MLVMNPITHTFNHDIAYCLECEEFVVLQYKKLIDDEEPNPRVRYIWECPQCKGYAYATDGDGC